MEKQKTPISLVIEEIENQQKAYIKLAKSDKKLKVGVDAILTATTILKMKLEALKQKEREMVINAYKEGWLNPSIPRPLNSHYYFDNNFTQE